MMRRLAAGLSAVGLMMVGLASLAPAASADAPGTVKVVVDGQEVQPAHGNSDNDPHVDCGFSIVFNGFTDMADGSTVTADLTVQPPSSPADLNVFHGTATVTGGHAEIPVSAVNFAGATANHTENGNNDSEKADSAPDPNELTYHVQLTTSATTKHKTFWLGGCPTTPGVATAASASNGGQLPTTLTDTATFANLSTETPPTGSVTFNVYGPVVTGGPVCTGTPTATSTKPMTANGVVTADPVHLTSGAGVYYWSVSYTGDANNGAVKEDCGGNNESSTVTLAPSPESPQIATEAAGTNSDVLPTTLTDTALLTGFGQNGPQGTVEFKLFGPFATANAVSCSGTPRATSSKSASASTESAGFSPTLPGIYVWVAIFHPTSGEGVLTEPCQGANESTTVTQLHPTISTNAHASNGAVLPTTLTDTATLAGFAGTPSGTMTFNVYGPFSGAGNCDSTPAATSTSTVTGASTTSAGFTPTAPGTYLWTASYSGDTNNAAVHEGCHGDNESTTVTAPPVNPGCTENCNPGCTVNCTPVVPTVLSPQVSVVKTNDAGGNPFAKSNVAKDAGDKVDFLATITNTSSETETITSITDSYGNVVNSPECANLIGTSLASGASTTCGFTINGYAPPAGSSITNTVAVGVKDINNQTANASDTSTVSTPAAQVLPEVATTVPPTTTTTTTAAPKKTPPATPTEVLPLAGSRTLPFTGTNVRLLLLAGLGLILLGLGLVAGTWRMPDARHYRN